MCAALPVGLVHPTKYAQPSQALPRLPRPSNAPDGRGDLTLDLSRDLIRRPGGLTCARKVQLLRVVEQFFGLSNTLLR